jgi:hypothetical protein
LGCGWRRTRPGSRGGKGRLQTTGQAGLKSGAGERVVSGCERRVEVAVADFRSLGSKQKRPERRGGKRVKEKIYF